MNAIFHTVGRELALIGLALLTLVAGVFSVWLWLWICEKCRRRDDCGKSVINFFDPDLLPAETDSVKYKRLSRELKAISLLENKGELKAALKICSDLEKAGRLRCEEANFIRERILNSQNVQHTESNSSSMSLEPDGELALETTPPDRLMASLDQMIAENKYASTLDILKPLMARAPNDFQLFEKYLAVLTTCRNFHGATQANREAVVQRRFSETQIEAAQKRVAGCIENDIAPDGLFRSRRKRKTQEQSHGNNGKI